MTSIARLSRWSAYARALARAELGCLRPRLSLALAVNGALPPLTMSRVRRRVLRLGGLDIGHGTTIGGRLRVSGVASPARAVTIGADCFVNDGCRLDTSASITIGERVFIGQDVAIITSTHRFGDWWKRASWPTSSPVKIGAGSWIGAGAMILPGVTIGDAVIVAAGSVVTRSVGADTLVGGVPARVIRDLPRDDSAPRPVTDGQRGLVRPDDDAAH